MNSHAPDYTNYTKEQLTSALNSLYFSNDTTLECLLAQITIVELLQNKYQQFDEYFYFNTYSQAGHVFFNRYQFNDAVNYYQKAINVKQKAVHIKLQQQNSSMTDTNEHPIIIDEEYRALAMRYIDLMDAYFPLYNTKAVLYAFHKAMNIHKCIKTPNSDEKLFFDKSFDVVKFRLHYEKKSSHDAFIHSSEYQRQNDILLQIYKEYFIDCLTDDMVEFGLDQASVLCNRIAQKQMEPKDYIELCNYYLSIIEAYIGKMLEITTPRSKLSEYRDKVLETITHVGNSYAMLPENHPHAPIVRLRINQLLQRLNNQISLIPNIQSFFSQSPTHPQPAHSREDSMDMDSRMEQNNSSSQSPAFYGQVFH